MHSLASIVLVLAVAILATCSAAGYKPTSPLKIGYWGSKPNGLTSTIDQVESALDNGYNVINFAFYNVKADGSMLLDAGSVTPTRKSQIHTTTQFTYLVSLFGGQSSVAPSITMSADDFARAMYNSFVALQQQYEFDGINVNLESVWGTTPTVVVCALRSFFKLMHNAGYIVSLAPQPIAVSPYTSVYAAGSWNAYVPLLDTGIISNIDIVSVKMYNSAIYGDNAATYTDSLTNGFTVSGCPACDGTVTGKVMIPAAKLAHGWPASSVASSGCPGQAAGCPLGSALSTLYSGSASLKATAGVSAWAIEFDASNSWQFINAAVRIAFNGAGGAHSNPATAKPATQAPAPATAKPATQAPVPATQAPTSKPATQAPVPATQSPATSAPIMATQGTTKCRITWTQTLSSSWTQGCNTVSMFTVTMYADAPLANFQFTLSGNGAVTSVWDAAPASNGYSLPAWLFSGPGGTMAKGQVASFGYIIVSTTPATISVIGDPCQ